MTGSNVAWGVVGAYGYAVQAALPAIAAADGSSCVAVLSRDMTRARTASAGYDGRSPAAFDDLDAFLATPGMDAVWITSPTYLHHTHASAALEAGLHVLLEKPLAYTSKESWELVAKAEAAGRVLATGFQARYVPGHARMREIVAAGDLGDVSAVRSLYAVSRDGPPQQWRQQRATAHWGALADLGTHHLDLMRMIVGEVIDVSPALDAHQLRFETEDAAAAALRFATGGVGSLTVSTNAALNATRVEVHGSAGSLVAEDTSPDGAGPVTWLRPGRPPEDLAGDRPWSCVAQVETVAAVIGGADVPYATGADGARNIELLEQLVP